METATDTNHTAAMKRARFNLEPVNDLTSTTSTSKTAPPKGLAECLINKAITSLHPEYATIVGRLGKEHLTFLSKLEHKKKQKQRFICREGKVEKISFNIIYNNCLFFY